MGHNKVYARQVWADPTRRGVMQRFYGLELLKLEWDVEDEMWFHLRN